MHSRTRFPSATAWAVALVAAALVTLVGIVASAATAAFSGANGKIAFQTNRDGNAEIYTMNADGTNRVNLTRLPSQDVDPRWSADGQRIVFASDRDGNHEIHTMNEDGSGVAQLTTTTVNNRWPSWTRDGRILFHSGAFPNRDVYRMNGDGTGLTNLTPGPQDSAWAATAPRGSTIAFSRVSDAEGQRLYTMNTRTGATKLVTPAPSELADAQANWSPRGNKLVFVRLSESGSELFVVRKNGRDLTQLTNTPTRTEFQPSFSPDGKQIVFHACSGLGTGDQHCANYVMDLDDGVETEVSLRPQAPYLDDFDDNYRDPAWHTITFGSGAAIAETNGRLEITLAAGSVAGGPFAIIEAHYGLNCSLPGDFDMQADYSLLEWPRANGVFTQLAGFFVNAGVARQSDIFGEKYNAQSNPLFSVVPTADMSGSLRLVRSGGAMRAYYLDPLFGWVQFLDAPAHAGDAVPGLSASSTDGQFSHEQVRVAFDNFRITSGHLRCPSWWDDSAPDWQPIARDDDDGDDDGDDD